MNLGYVESWDRWNQPRGRCTARGTAWSACHDARCATDPYHRNYRYSSALFLGGGLHIPVHARFGGISASDNCIRKLTLSIYGEMVVKVRCCQPKKNIGRTASIALQMGGMLGRSTALSPSGSIHNSGHAHACACRRHGPKRVKQPAASKHIKRAHISQITILQVDAQAGVPSPLDIIPVNPTTDLDAGGLLGPDDALAGELAPVALDTAAEVAVIVHQPGPGAALVRPWEPRSRAERSWFAAGAEVTRVALAGR